MSNGITTGRKRQKVFDFVESRILRANAFALVMVIRRKQRGRPTGRVGRGRWGKERQTAFDLALSY
jgi:hypothetical protein